ncbi:MAG: O-acetyl-ADP-ribose deacetylase [Chlorobi bacterium]|nr:O-acetyl-ADP-ribose deacetylase [Chlorobiota bacterium]
MKGRIALVKGDITRIQADAIVNAANPNLLGGGGVDGAIHAAAGPELREYCRTCGGARPGEAKISPGFRLPAKYIIHAVGPRWQGGHRGEAEILRQAYLNSLRLASEHGIKTIAFPNISTGIYGYPKEEAARIAISTVKEYLENHPEIERVIFVTYDDENYRIYKRLLGDEAEEAG